MLRDAHPAILETLEHARSIHILGAGLNPEKPAHQAVHDLDGAGWRLVPVHPKDAGGSVLGRPIRNAIEKGIQPEVVVLFLAPQRAREAVRQLVLEHGTSSMPLVWFQPGSEDEDTLEMLNDAGILHIVDDCIVRFVQRHHLKAANPHPRSPWFLQVASDDASGCSVWTVQSPDNDVAAPATALEWCGDEADLRESQHTVPRYIRSLANAEEPLVVLANRLAQPAVSGRA